MTNGHLRLIGRLVQVGALVENHDAVVVEDGLALWPIEPSDAISCRDDVAPAHAGIRGSEVPHRSRVVPMSLVVDGTLRDLNLVIRVALGASCVTNRHLRLTARPIAQFGGGGTS